MSPRCILAMLGSLALVACGSSNIADLEEYVRKVKEREPRPIKPLPEIKRIDTFVFVSKGRRNPFVLDAVGPAPGMVSGLGISPNIIRRKEELERFPLDSLSMVGTLEQGETVWGLIRTPEGTLAHVSVGNHMGKNYGEIIRITEAKIDLTEIVPDGGGKWRERKASIALSQ